jgi:uncharacterized iron-regulated protein
MTALKFIKSSFILASLLVILQVFFLNESYAEKINVFRVSDRKAVTFEKMVDEIKKSNLLFVGESHNIAAHHKLQLDVIKRLNELKVPLAVGFEMFTAESQAALNRWTSGTISTDDFIKIYYKNWNFPWPLYKDILLYVRDNKIPSIGLNLLPEITRKVARGGFSSLTKEELKKLPPETGCVVSERYIYFIRRAYSMHGHEGTQFIYFCEAQLLWDQVMARNLLEFHKNNPEKVIVVLTGNGHAWKGGIPEQVRKLSEKTSLIVLLPEVIGNIDADTVTIEDADYILLQ